MKLFHGLLSHDRGKSVSQTYITMSERTTLAHDLLFSGLTAIKTMLGAFSSIPMFLKR